MYFVFTLNLFLSKRICAFSSNPYYDFKDWLPMFRFNLFGFLSMEQNVPHHLLKPGLWQSLCSDFLQVDQQGALKHSISSRLPPSNSRQFHEVIGNKSGSFDLTIATIPDQNNGGSLFDIFGRY